MEKLTTDMKVTKRLKDDVINTESDSGHGTESDDNTEHEDNEETHSDSETPYKMQIVWPNVVKFIILHILCMYGFSFLPYLSVKSWLWFIGTYWFAATGVTAGAHRLWSHKAYKAKFPLRLLLTVANSMAGENSIYVWSRDHRVHHKCSETVGDPHNAGYGLFFAHMGWLMVRKHPAVINAGKKISMADLEADSLVMFQNRHYLKCFILSSFVIPTLVPYFLWDESLTTAYFIAMVRYVTLLHSTWLVNSAAHFYGNKPYDSTIGAVENMFVSVLAVGEGFHNYHHTFPYDYSTSEWGFRINITTAFIDLMSKLGLAYNLRKANPETVSARATRTGKPELTRDYVG